MSAISVVLPAFNEAYSLQQNAGRVQACLRALVGAGNYELIVVDDGSTDATGAIAEGLREDDSSVVVLRHSHNRGLAAAVRTGAQAASGEVVAVLDCDLTYSPEILSELHQSILAGNDVALASPYMRGGRSTNVPRLRQLLSTSANAFLSLAARGEIRTLTCMVRAYRRDVLQALLQQHPGANVTFDLLFAARAAGARIAEIPAHLDWSAQPASRGRRVRLRNAAMDVVCVLRSGLRERPTLWLALPGLLPGVLPLAVAVGWALHAPGSALLRITIVTVVIQYTSLAVVSWDVGTFLHRITRRPLSRAS